MSDTWSGSGYGAKVPKSGGVYLRLKAKGEAVRLRLVSEPFRFTDVIRKDGQDDKLVNKAAWVAIHKFMEDSKPVKSEKPASGPAVRLTRPS